MNVNRHTCDFSTVATQNICGGNRSAEHINCLGFVLYIVLMHFLVIFRRKQQLETHTVELIFTYSITTHRVNVPLLCK